MKIHGIPYRSLWVKQGDPHTIQLIDQRYLPHKFVIEEIRTLDEIASAIQEMHLRGAPLIGVAAAFGMYLALLDAPSDQSLEKIMEDASSRLKATRPTAVNLQWAIERQLKVIRRMRSKEEGVQLLFEEAQKMAEEDVESCRRIGEHGLRLIEAIRAKKGGGAVHILTHCNAGWLACIDWGTATSPMYQAFDKGIDLHIWVNETRPRNQGASLTAWELGQHGVSHTVIVDNASGYLMQRRKIDLAIVGSDRTTATGDVANKIGTYLMALAAHDNGIPFYVALPSTSIDWEKREGISEILIEERRAEEVTHIQGLCDGEIKKVLLTPRETQVANYAFDVTPRRLVTALITERGVCPATEEGLLQLFPEKRMPP
ncbi:MAG: S-methyl-5-thioribose-1-phosphate isomerase [Candidatus Omnitrophica bacterium]|nr:S-methyl-5-thioribose-1-phosphate isomerase [Candidatus Omnitrophota bacterium]